MKKNLFWVIGGVFVVSLLVVGIVYAFGVGNVDGVWEFVEDGSDESATCDSWGSDGLSAYSGSIPGIQSSGGNLTDENQVRYGEPPSIDRCPNSWSEFILQSGFGFNGINGPLSNIDLDEEFYLGSFIHYNQGVNASGIDLMEWVDLAVTVPVDCDDNGTTYTTFAFVPRFHLDETPNWQYCGYSGYPACEPYACRFDGVNYLPCPYPNESGNYCPGQTGVNSAGCADAVTIEQPTNTTFTCSVGGVDTQYTVNILGFTSDSSGYDPNEAETQYVTVEQATNTAYLWAEIDAPQADARISKNCTDTETEDYYTVTVVNTGPGTALGAQIVDTLPAGATFVSYSSNITIGGVTTPKGTCTRSGQVLTCDLNAALPENTTADPTAKWEVRIDVDLFGDQLTNTATLTTTSVDTNLTNNRALATCVPNSVSLLSFTAEQQKEVVELKWETANEIDNLGFNLYRSTSLEDKKVQINEQLIPTQVYPGSPFGAAYSFIDKLEPIKSTTGIRSDSIFDRFRAFIPVQPVATYYYWLESVSITGTTHLHEPVSIKMTLK